MQNLLYCFLLLIEPKITHDLHMGSNRCSLLYIAAVYDGPNYAPQFHLGGVFRFVSIESDDEFRLSLYPLQFN